MLSTHRDQHSSIEEINSLKVEIQILNEQLQKMSEKNRSTQRCSYCQETGGTYLHCEVLLTGGQGVVKPSDLKGGIYAVYSTPCVGDDYSHHPQNEEVDLCIPPRELRLVETENEQLEEKRGFPHNK